MAKAKASQAARATVTTTTTRSGGVRRVRRRRQRQPTRTTTTTKKVVMTGARLATRRRILRRLRRPRGDGRVITQTVTATLGTVGSNQGNNVEMELSMLINPALAKETTGSNQFGPIQMCAATYSQWKLKWANLKLTPLVGQSAVSGTVVRCSLNMTGNPSSSSWSALGARKHADATPGKSAVLKLTHADFPGPKEGWYNTNPKGDPNMSIGGSIEVHSLGKTMSTYQAVPFAGDLFLVEMTATWLFRNYNPQPGLLNLVKGSSDAAAPQTVTIEATAGEPITMSVPSASRFGRATSSAAASEIIWQVADTTISLITSAFPPPFGWLFKGGWWFIKRVAGAPVRAGEETFRVYSSIQDARADVPCIASADSTTTINSAGWDYTQVTPGNTGLGDIAGYSRVIEPTMSTFDPTQPFILDAVLTKLPPGTGQEPVAPYSPVFTSQTASETVGSTEVWWPRWGIGVTSDPANGLVNGVTTTTIIKVTGVKLYQANGWASNNLMDISPTSSHYGVYQFQVVGGENTTTPLGYTYAYTRYNSGDFTSMMLLFRAEVTRTIQLLPKGPTPTPCVGWAFNRQITQTGSTPWNGTKFEKLSFNFPSTNITIENGSDYILHFGIYGPSTGLFNLGNCTVSRPSGATLSPASTVWITGTTEAAQAGAIPSVGYGLKFQVTRPLQQNSRGEWVEDQVVVEHADTPVALPGNINPANVALDHPLDGFFQRMTISSPTPSLTPSEEAWLEEQMQVDPPSDDEELIDTILEGETYGDPPSYVLDRLSKKGQLLYDQLKDTMEHKKALFVAQTAHPTPIFRCWQDTYHDALVDGSSPPQARSEAWKRVLALSDTRGHAE